MALIRAEHQDWNGDSPIRDGIVEYSDDLVVIEKNGYAEYGGSRLGIGPGSAMYCLEDQKVYVMQSDGTFTAIGG